MDENWYDEMNEASKAVDGNSMAPTDVNVDENDQPIDAEKGHVGKNADTDSGESSSSSSSSDSEDSETEATKPEAHPKALEDPEDAVRTMKRSLAVASSEKKSGESSPKVMKADSRKNAKEVVFVNEMEVLKSIDVQVEDDLTEEGRKAANASIEAFKAKLEQLQSKMNRKPVVTVKEVQNVDPCQRKHTAPKNPAPSRRSEPTKFRSEGKASVGNKRGRESERKSPESRRHRERDRRSRSRSSHRRRSSLVKSKEIGRMSDGAKQSKGESGEKAINLVKEDGVKKDDCPNQNGSKGGSEDSRPESSKQGGKVDLKQNDKRINNSNRSNETKDVSKPSKDNDSKNPQTGKKIAAQNIEKNGDKATDKRSIKDIVAENLSVPIPLGKKSQSLATGRVGGNQNPPPSRVTKRTAMMKPLAMKGGGRGKGKLPVTPRTVESSDDSCFGSDKEGETKQKEKAKVPQGVTEQEQKKIIAEKKEKAFIRVGNVTDAFRQEVKAAYEHNLDMYKTVRNVKLEISDRPGSLDEFTAEVIFPMYGKEPLACICDKVNKTRWVSFPCEEIGSMVNMLSDFHKEYLAKKEALAAKAVEANEVAIIDQVNDYENQD